MCNSSNGRGSGTIPSGVVGSGLIPATNTQNGYLQLLYVTPGIEGTVLLMKVMTVFKTQNLRKFRTSFSFSFGFDFSRKIGFGSS